MNHCLIKNIPITFVNELIMQFSCACILFPFSTKLVVNVYIGWQVLVCVVFLVSDQGIFIGRSRVVSKIIDC